MVAPIYEHKGEVDKYIGDAIKAFFGSRADPERNENFALASVLAGLKMTERLASFNAEQQAAGKEPWAIGIGINYGVVTIGNIGTEKKKEYTVIGETVELAEHFEGLTKIYKQPLIISESIHQKVKDDLPCRLLDSIPWRRGTKMRIYTARRILDAREKQAWGLHDLGMAAYQAGDFAKAASHFRDALKILPGDQAAALILERCMKSDHVPPPPHQRGAKTMTAT